MNYSRQLGAVCALFFIFTSSSLTAAVVPGPTPPFIESADTVMFEDTSDHFFFQAGLGNNDGSEFLTVTVTGIDPTWTIDTTILGGTYDAGTGVWSITLPAGQNYAGGFGVTSPTDSDVDMTGLTITATTTLIATGATDSVTDSGLNVFVDAVADLPNVVVADAFGTLNTPIDLNLAAFATDTDGSESITDILLSSLPGGSFLSAGTDLGSGLWQLTTSDLIGLTLTSSTSGLFALDMDVTAVETSILDFESTTANNMATNSASFNVTVSAVPVPAAFWLFGSGLVGLVGMARQKKEA